MQDFANTDTILIMGLGHTGCRVLESIASLDGYNGIDMVAVDTDAGDLKALEPKRIRTLLLGREAVGGHGTGGDYEQAKYIFMDSASEITREVSGRSLLILIAALGGGTGGAAEEVLKIADENMVPIVFLAVMPFAFEGNARIQQAEELLSQMDNYCQVLVRVPNDKILMQYTKNPASDAFGRAAEYLAKAAVCLATPYACKRLLNASPSLLNSLSAHDGNPRCLLAHVSCGNSEDINNLTDTLTKQYVFEDSHLIENIDKGILILRIKGECTEEELDFAISQAKGLLPQADVVPVAITDDQMSDYMALTLLLHPSQAAYSEEESLEPSEEGEAEAKEEGAFIEQERPVQRRGRRGASDRQLQIPFEEEILGIFAGDPENEWNGSNIDIPTFRRLKITIDKGT